MLTPSSINRSARILIVDDEPHICAAVARALSLAGYQAEEANDGPAALHRLQSAAYDLMILDLQMPEVDGLEVMQRARQLQPDLLMIILTGHATMESAIAAVKSEAVDYLLKPVSLHAIVAAAANALQTHAEQFRRQHLLQVMGETLDALRQTQPAVPGPSAEPLPERFVRAGGLTLDRQKRWGIIAGDQPRTVQLTEGEANVLNHLLEHPDQVHACRQIVQAVWGYTLIEREAQSLIRPYIFRLRQKIEADVDHPRLIQTVRGRGYLFAPP